MPKSLYVIPYKSGSKSAKALADALDVTLLRKENSRFMGNGNKIVINWGASVIPDNCYRAFEVLNSPQEIQWIQDKQRFFKKTGDFPHRPAARFKISDVINDYLVNDSNAIWFARTILNGHSGNGIEIIRNVEEAQAFRTPCNLFTKYIKKKDEYRVHFVNLGGADPRIIFSQRKGFVADRGVQRDPLIRNLANGYVYVNEGNHEGVALPAAVLNAVNAFLQTYIRRSNINFGAIDIIYNLRYNTAYILEVNSAPGLSGLTINAYADAFNEYNRTL